MKKISFVFLIGFLIITISACDYGLKYTKIEIINFPSKIIYFIGRDSQLDLSGGKIKLTTLSKSETILDMNGKDFSGEDEFDIIHSINFKNPGVYVVEIKRTKDLNCFLAIEVVDPATFRY